MPFLATINKFTVGNVIRILARLRVKNRVNVPQTGPVLIVGNHVSWFDPLLLTMAIPRPVRFVIVQGFYQKPVINFYSRLFRAIPIRKAYPRAALDAAVEALRNGEAVFIFPEGGLTQDGSLRKIKRGFEKVARRANCPVVPVGLRGLFGTALCIRRGWKKSDLWKKLWPQPVVEFGEPIPAESATAEVIEERLRELIDQPG